MAVTKIRKGQIGIIKESAQDTYTAIVSGSLIMAQDISYEITEADAFQRSELLGHFNKLDPIPGVAGVQFSFTVNLCGAGTAGTAPNTDTAFLACGLRKKVTTSTSVAYEAFSNFDAAVSGSNPAYTNPGPSYTICLIEDNIAYYGKGCWGNVEFNCEVGKPIQATFTFQGAYAAPAASGTFSTVTYPTVVPPTFLSAGVTLPLSGSTWSGPVFTNLKYNLGNEVNLRRNANDSAGIVGAIISDRRITGSIDPEAVDPGTANIFTAFRAGSSGAISTTTIGGTAGNRIAITAPRCVYSKLGMADRNGLRSYGLDFDVVSLATDADGSGLVITFS